MTLKNKNDNKKQKLRSQAWWDNSAHPDMTALYLERFLNYGLTREELQSGRPIIGIARPVATSYRAIGITSPWQIASRPGYAMAAAFPSSFRYIPCKRPASARPRRWTATLPISGSSRCCSAIRSTASS
jgi:hypothetical protein